MKPLIALAAFAAALAIPAFAQMQENTEHKLACDNNNHDSSRVRHCEMREQSFASIGRLSVDALQNGAVQFKGASRGDVLVRTRVESEADTDGEASSLASQVSIDGAGGQVHANGPKTQGHSSWSVSYEIFVPHNTDLTMKSNNGALSISDVRGNLHFELNNGAVRLTRVAGDVSGTANNGAISADLIGTAWEGRGLDLTTHNGSVAISLPSQYSAHVKAETGNGRIQSDFTSAPAADPRAQNVEFNIGAGGSPIHVTTHNGSVRIKRADAQ